MQETFQEYKKRILGYVVNQDPLRIQAASAKKLEKLIRGVPRARLLKRPAPGKWSVAEILAHLAESEMVAGYRTRLILSNPGVPVQGFDQDKWAELGGYVKRDPRKSLEIFRLLRETNLLLLKSLTPEQWKCSGIHTERGEENVETIAQMFAGHDVNHIRQVEAILSKRK